MSLREGSARGGARRTKYRDVWHRETFRALDHALD
jgi:hypothetical protein